jgi:hypothetical protein
MKKLLAILFFLFSTPALASVPCGPMQFQLQNGQVADATQVMINFNQLVTCFGGAALAGNNNDITALSALTTPISPALGGTSTFLATAPSTAPVSQNAQVVSTTQPNYVQITLTTVVFIAGFSNTGPMSTSVSTCGGPCGLTVGSTPQTTVLRRTTDGLQPLAGGEIIAGTVTAVMFDGTQYQLISNVSPIPIGTVQDTIATAADRGFLLLNGSCASTTTFSSLWNKLGSPGTAGCGAGQWALPDARGRVVAMVDSSGSARLTVVCSVSTALFTGCGGQQYQLLQTDLPNVAPTITVSLSDPGHVHTYTQPNSPTAIAYAAGGGSSTLNAVAGNTAAQNTSNVTTGVGVSSSTSSSINGNVAQTLFGVVQPTLLLNKQIKY